MKIEQFRPTPEKDIKGAEGESLYDEVQEKRDALAFEIKEKRRDSDESRRQSKKISTKILSKIGKSASPEELFEDADDNRLRARYDLRRGKKEITDFTEGKTRELIEETLYDQVNDLKNLYDRFCSIEYDDMNNAYVGFKKAYLNGDISEEAWNSWLNKHASEVKEIQELDETIIRMVTNFDLSNYETIYNNEELRKEFGRICTPLWKKRIPEKMQSKFADSVLQYRYSAVIDRGMNVLDYDNDILSDLSNIYYSLSNYKTDAYPEDLLDVIQDQIQGSKEIDLAKIDGNHVLDKLLERDKFRIYFTNYVNIYLDKVFTADPGWIWDPLCRSMNDIVREAARDRLGNYLKAIYGISTRDIEDAWHINKYDGGTYDVGNNLIAMEKLEKSIPGAVNKLLSNYGIKEFCRYPTDVLVKQIEEESIDRPYGLVAFPRSDHNDAFNQDKDYIDNLFQKTQEVMGMKIVEVSSRIDFAKRLIVLNKKYGDENKISYLIIGGHGSVDKFIFGEGELGEVRSEHFEGKGVQRVKEFFVDNPAVVLISCSTGVDGGIAEKMSETYGSDVIGPSKDAALMGLDMDLVDGKPKFKVEYGGADAKFYKGVEKDK